MKKLKYLLVFVLIFLLLPLTSVFGWNSHGLTLSYVISDIDWLDKYDSITITPYTYSSYETEQTNPGFKIQYLEGKVGDKTTAKKILAIYADEPDWGLDQNMNLSKLQMLTGGSQGYRHMYYKIGFISVGTTPDQVNYYFNMAKIASMNDDYYWTFRFLARAIHYMEDITQPYHGVPGPTSIVLRNIFSGISGLTLMCSNHHYALEDYQGYMVSNKDPAYISTLREDYKVMDVSEVKSLAYLTQYAASLNRARVRVLWPLENKLFGDAINSKTVEYKLNVDDIANFDKSIQSEYDEAILYSLKYFNGFSRLLLEYAKVNLGL